MQKDEREYCGKHRQNDIEYKMIENTISFLLSTMNRKRKEVIWQSRITQR